MDISNRSLAFLLVVAIVISAGGTFVSLTTMTDLGISGMAPTDTGDANLTIESTVSINFDVDAINFGTGYVIGGSGNCVLDTNSTSNASPNDRCSGFDLTTTPFIINNTGNTDARLQLTSDSTAATFVGGTGGEELQWWMDEAEANACLGGQGSIFDDWEEINTTIYEVCSAGNFESTDDDTLELHIRVLIPDDATQVGTERTVQILATAS